MQQNSSGKSQSSSRGQANSGSGGGDGTPANLQAVGTPPKPIINPEAVKSTTTPGLRLQDLQNNTP